MSLYCSVYPLHSSSLFGRFSPLSFQHDISPQCCFTQSGLLDNKCASYTAPSLHQLLSAIHLTHLPLAGPPRPYAPRGAPERHKAGCVFCLSLSHCNQPPPPTPHAGRPCVTVLEKEAHQLGKSFRGGWKFALFPFAWSHKIWNMLRLCWHFKSHWLDHAHESNERKPFYIFNKRVTN